MSRLNGILCRLVGHVLNCAALIIHTRNKIRRSISRCAIIYYMSMLHISPVPRKHVAAWHLEDRHSLKRTLFPLTSPMIDKLLVPF